MVAGLTLREIILLADTLVSNSVQLTSKVSWINQIMNQAYRDYPTLEAIQPFAVTAGQDMYPLPDDCAEDRVSQFTLLDERYEYFLPDDVSTEDEINRCITVVNGVALLIYPTPTANGTGMLYYKPRPSQLTIADLDIKPNFPADFHEMLVSGLAARLAKTSPDTIGLVSIHESDFLRMAEKADLVITKKRQKRVIRSRAWA